jgi:hypothetical protein
MNSCLDRRSQTHYTGGDTMIAEDILNGSVQSQGFRVGVENWLAMGSPEWDSTPDEIKAGAYQAAGITGWSDIALKAILIKKCPFMNEDMAGTVLDILKDLARQYPLEII